MPNSMATMQGCCTCGSVSEPCYICPCLVGQYNIHLLVPRPYITYEDPASPEDEEVFDAGMEFLMGYIKLGPIGNGVQAAPYCSGGWNQACPWDPPIGPAIGVGISWYEVCDPEDGAVLIGAIPMWQVSLSSVTKELYVELVWWTPGCDEGGGSLPIYSVVAGIRWRYTWETAACEDVPDLTWDGDTKYLDQDTSTWVSVSDGNVVAWRGPADFGPTDPRFEAINVDTPPEVFLDRENCSEDACCATEGGRPTAIMDITLSDCLITAEDVSVAGTCGAITRRLWVLEVWDEQPTVEELTGEDCSTVRETKSWYGEGATNETLITSAGGFCGKAWFRLTLHVWDELDCHSEATSPLSSCCSCQDSEGNPCANPPGSLSVTPHEEFECCYVLEAVGDDTGYEGVCSDTVVIEWRIDNGGCDGDRICSCLEIEEGDCGGPSCSGGLNFGSTYLLCIDQATTLQWRARETACGCWGSWNEVELPCINCLCCDKAISNVALTVSGVAEASSCAGCPAANGTYELEGNLGGGGGCFWGVNLFDVFSCTCEGTCTRGVQINCVFTCTEDKIIVEGFFLADGGTNFKKEVSISGEGPYNCELLEGAMTLYDQGDAGCTAPTSIVLSFDYA